MATLVLLLIAKPFSWKLFIAGLVIISLGEAIRLWASGYLKKDKELAVTGPYRIVRHPLYVGSFLIALGFTLICINPAFPYRTGALIAVVFLGFKFVYSKQVQAEETHLDKLFGQDYQAYIKQVSPFFPNLKNLPKALKESSYSLAQAKKNKEFTTVMGIVVFAIVLAIKLYFKL